VKSQTISIAGIGQVPSAAGISKIFEVLGTDRTMVIALMHRPDAAKNGSLKGKVGKYRHEQISSCLAASDDSTIVQQYRGCFASAPQGT
jgi:hypothetical protein